MAKRRTPTLQMIRRAALPALATLIVANFVYYAVAGSNGILALGGYRQAHEEKAAELKVLEAERDVLAHRTKLLDPRKADPDLADELVRRDMGLVRPDEVVIPLEDAPPRR